MRLKTLTTRARDKDVRRTQAKEDKRAAMSSKTVEFAGCVSTARVPDLLQAGLKVSVPVVSA